MHPTEDPRELSEELTAAADAVGGELARLAGGMPDGGWLSQPRSLSECAARLRDGGHDDAAQVALGLFMAQYLLERLDRPGEKELSLRTARRALGSALAAARCLRLEPRDQLCLNMLRGGSGAQPARDVAEAATRR